MASERMYEKAAAGRDADTAPCGALADVELPVRASDVTLVSGRRYEVCSEAEGDRLTVRGRGGAVMLRVLLTDAGPVLSFEGADIEIAAARRLALSAEAVSIEARRAMAVEVGGDCTETIAGTRHTRVRGSERLEAANVQLQTNEGAMELRSAQRIALDGDHIGLNDDPCPQPFGWSALANGPEQGA